jgi:hypothetical protein
MGTRENVSEIKACPSMAYVVDQTSISYINSSIAGCVTNVLFAITGTLLNTMVVYIFWKTNKLTTKVAYFFIMVLSFTDLCAAVTVHALYILNSVGEITGAANCLYKLFYQNAQLLFSGQSAMTLFALNIERYLSILHPVFHRNCVTKRRCATVLLILCLVPFALAFSRFFDSDIQTFITGMTIMVCLVSAYVYIAIYYTATRKMMNNARKQQATFLKEVKLAKTCFCIVACCFILYLPNGIMLAVHTEQTRTLNVLVHIKVWTTSLVTINSTVNCFVLLWTNREIRQAWRALSQGKHQI